MLSINDSCQFDLLKQLTVTRPDGTRSVGEDYRGSWYLAWRKGGPAVSLEDAPDVILQSVVLVLQAASRNGGQPASEKIVVALVRHSAMPSRWVLRITMAAFGTIIDVECEPEGGKEMMAQRRLVTRPSRQQLRDDCCRLLKRQLVSNFARVCMWLVCADTLCCVER